MLLRAAFKGIDKSGYLLKGVENALTQLVA